MKWKGLTAACLFCLLLAPGLCLGALEGETGARDDEGSPRKGTLTSPAGQTPLLAGLLEKLMDKGSKERKIFEGVTSIISSAAEMDYETELTIGESLALEGFRRYGMPVNDPALQRYVNLVGCAVARNSLRPAIPYHFVVVDNPLINAFSCPGGIIFICSGLVRALRTEAQLACILAHEVAHVGHKHALKSIQRAQFFQGVGKITAATMEGEKGRQFEQMIGNLQTVLFDRGLDKNMEFEADLTGMQTAYRTGYGPNGMIEVLQGLILLQARSRQKGSWFSTHPPPKQRLMKCMSQASRYPDWKSMAQLPGRFRSYKARLQ